MAYAFPGKQLRGRKHYHLVSRVINIHPPSQQLPPIRDTPNIDSIDLTHYNDIT